jgi:hypothetical protein
VGVIGREWLGESSRHSFEERHLVWEEIVTSVMASYRRTSA